MISNRNINCVEHAIGMSETEEKLIIGGFTGQLQGEVFLIPAYGHRYRDYGITRGSLLLCSRSVVPTDGDLVIKMHGDQAVLYLLRPGSPDRFEGTKRILSDAGEADAVVICSLNFYQ